MKLKNILSTAILVLGFASCSNEIEEAIGGQGVPLQITANIDGTRAAGVNDREFKDGEYIGFYVSGIDNAWNVLATYNTNEKRWMLDNDNIMLDGQERLVRAYYPYDRFGTMENFLGFPVSAGVNHLVSDNVYVNNKKPVAILTFRHLMARVMFVVNNPEKLELSNITLSGKNIYSTGLYYFEDDYVSCWNNEQPVVVENQNEDKTAEVQSIDALLIPAAAGETEVTLNFANGKKYTTKVTLPELKQGGFYRLPITLEEPNEEIEIDGHKCVDLGLPSGTLWATMNVGASSPEDGGNFYAWGETTIEDIDQIIMDIMMGNNKWRNPLGGWIKYCEEDGKTVLDLEDDVANVTWGGGWRIPSKEQAEELFNPEYCTFSMDHVYAKFKIKSKINNNYIYLPYVGYLLNGSDQTSRYWLNSISSSNPDEANYFYYGKEIEGDMIYKGTSNSDRTNAYKVRPVLCK